MALNQSPNTAFTEVDYFGVAIKRGSPTQNHCAILYKLDDELPKLLHLGNHFWLIHNNPTDHYLWSNLEAVDQPTRRLLAVLAGTIAAAKPGIPYGISPGGISFDPETGALIPGAPGKGMTCATFVLAVLKVHGIELLKLDEWPENVDEAWQQWVVDELLEGQASEAHRAAVANDVGCLRPKPEHVAAGFTMEDLPVSYPDAERVAAEIIAELNAAYEAAA